MTDTDYGVLLQVEDTPAGSGVFTSVGEIVNLDIPKVMTGSVEKTHHASGGFRDFIPDGLMTLDSFPVTLNLVQAAYSNMYLDMKAKTIKLYKVLFPAGVGIINWEFSAFPLELDIQEADATSPSIMQVIATMRPTGEPSGMYSGG